MHNRNSTLNICGSRIFCFMEHDEASILWSIFRKSANK